MSGNGVLIPAEGGVFKGNIVTLQHGMRIELRPDPRHDAHNPDSPKFVIVSPTRDGSAAVKVGAAWEKTSTKTGEVFLSLGIDDPSFAEPLFVSAFPREGGGFDIVWRRSRRVAGRDVRPDPGRTDEEIPF